MLRVFARACYASKSGSRSLAFNASLSKPLSEVDPETYSIVQREDHRQREGIELIASEVCTLHFPLK
jgi:hypothetical protein